MAGVCLVVQAIVVMVKMRKGWFTAAELNIVGEKIGQTLLKASDLLLATVRSGRIQDLSLLPASMRTTPSKGVRSMKAPKTKKTTATTAPRAMKIKR